MIIINKKEYSWGSIRVFLAGRMAIGITKVEYKPKIEKELRYGHGDTAHGIQHGNRSVDGSIEVSQSELIALERAAKKAGYRDLLDVEIDIVVTYEMGGVVTVETVSQASFTEAPRAMSQGDKSMKVTLPFIALGII